MSGNIMSGSRRLDPACLSVGLFNQQMKNFCEKHQCRQWLAVFIDVWRSLFFTPFAGPTKDEYLSYFLEVVPRLVIPQMLHPVVRLLLRLVVVVVVVIVVVILLLRLLLLLLLKTVFNIASPST